MKFQGHELKVRRIHAGFSRSDLAADDCTAENLRLIEDNGTQPRPPLAKALADRLGIDVSEFWTDDEVEVAS